MVSEFPQNIGKSRNGTPVGTPVAELEELNLSSRTNTPAPPSNTMSNEISPSPSGTPPPTSSGLKFSFAKGVAPKATSKPPSKLSNGITAFQGRDESDSEEESISRVTHFENGTEVSETTTAKEEKKPLVIKPPAESNNEHWLQRRLKMFRPDLVEDKQPEGVDLSSIPDQIGNITGKVGLQVPTKVSPQTDSPQLPQSEEMPIDVPAKTDDELARELLLAQAYDPSASTSTAPRLVIPANKEPLSESDVYAYDMARLSDAPTLETYERVPVEAFGMGILLGLGWKEGTDLQGKKVEAFKEPKRRPDFLGIGAKEEEFLKVNAKGDKLSRKDALGGSWNPLKKIDKRTGEVIVEDTKDSRRSTPKDRSGVNTPKKDGSRYSTPSGGYESGRDRDRERRWDDDRDRRRDDDGDRRKEGYRDDGRSRDDRRYDSDRESKRRDRDYESDRKRRNRDYDSDYERKKRRDGEHSRNGSRRESRRASPERSRSPRKDR
jgi:hypothetical protein